MVLPSRRRERRGIRRAGQRHYNCRVQNRGGAGLQGAPINATDLPQPMIQRAELPTPGPLQHRVSASLRVTLVLCALAYFGNVVFQTYTYQIEHYGHAQVALALLLLVVLVASWRTVSARSISLVAFLVYLAWSFGSATVPVSDFLVNYWEKAAAFAAERSIRNWSHSLSPPTIAYYGLFIAMLGKSYCRDVCGKRTGVGGVGRTAGQGTDQFWR